MTKPRASLRRIVTRAIAAVVVVTSAGCGSASAPPDPRVGVFVVGGGAGGGGVMRTGSGEPLDCQIANGVTSGDCTTDEFLGGGGGNAVELEASPDPGSSFAGWTCHATPSGVLACAECAETGACRLPLSFPGYRRFDITATFDLVPAGACPVDQPLGHWALDGDAQDQAGAADGPTSLPAGVTIVADRGGSPSGALRFDGTAGLSLGSGDTYDDLQLPFSFAGWIWRDADGPSSASLFATDDLFGTYAGIWAQVVDGSFFLSYGTGGPPGVPTRRTAGGVPIPADQWAHVAGVIRGPTDASLFLDGVEVVAEFSGTGVGPMAHESTGGPNIGSWQLLVSNMPWKGRLDDLRLYECQLDQAAVQFLAGSG